MQKRVQRRFLNISAFALTLIMIILRFLLNEKGRISPDSIRLMRFAHNLPIIDNTTTPVGYPLIIKIFTFSGIDEFWASKLIGITSYLFIIIFAWKKRFYLRETLLTCGLFSFVSIFAATLTEPLFLPFIFLFIYVCRNIIVGKWKKYLSILYLSLCLIFLYYIRYTSLFLMGACFLYGILRLKYKYSKIFITSSLIGFLFILIYKFTFIDYFNENYVKHFIKIGLKPTSTLIQELLEGLATSFNPFVHIANPGGGIINIGVYGIGILNIFLIIFLSLKSTLSETEKFIIFTGIVAIICSFFIQYFYQTDPLDYRLLSGFTFFIWLVYFKKLHQIFGKTIYLVTFISLICGFLFSWLSRGNYLENRKIVQEFLLKENLTNKKIYFYKDDYTDTRNAEIISTVNSNLVFTRNPQDTLNKKVLTNFRLEKKMKINKNQFR